MAGEKTEKATPKKRKESRKEGVLVLSTAITLAQGGLYVASKMMKPDLGKLSLLKGAKRMFGPQAWWELAKMLIKTLLVTGLVYQTVSTLIPMIGGLVPLTAAISVGSDHAFSMLRNVALAGVAMGALDYLMARRRITKATNMTKQEVKDEHKQAEGDPMLKGQIRSRQLANARNRMIADVMESDVVLVNPTHVAVALRYQPERGAPVVVARGAGVVAARIREVATDAGVPLGFCICIRGTSPPDPHGRRDGRAEPLRCRARRSIGPPTPGGRRCSQDGWSSELHDPGRPACPSSD